MNVFKRPLALALSKSEIKQVNRRVLEDNNFHVGVCVTVTYLGVPRGNVSLFRRRRGKEQLGEADFDSDVLFEPTARLEVVKHVTCYGKIRSDGTWNSMWPLKKSSRPIGSPVGKNLPVVAICSPPHDFCMPTAA